MILLNIVFDERSTWRQSLLNDPAADSSEFVLSISLSSWFPKTVRVRKFVSFFEEAV